MPTPSIEQPEYCPNPSCRFYDRSIADSHLWYYRHGSFHTNARGTIERFRCRSCGKCCSTQTFSIHYWTHSTNDLVWLLHLLYSRSGLRQISRFAGCAYRVIENRIRRVARNSLAVMDAVFENLELQEDLTMDGLESYTRSQYHPNNFTTIVGSDSQFLYSVVHTLLRRSGRMTDRQKAMRGLIDMVWKPPRSALRSDCQSMLHDMAPSMVAAAQRRGQLRIYTDEHNAYPKAIRGVRQLAEQTQVGRLVHHRTNSRKRRTKTNPLFAVNYVDRQMRKNMGEHVRETITQGREVNCQMERMAVFMVLHNFFTPHRIGDRVDGRSYPSRGECAGLQTPRVRSTIRRYLTHRHIYGHCRGKPERIRRVWKHAYETPPVVRVRQGLFVGRSVAMQATEMPAYLTA